MESLYTIVWLDAMYYKVGDGGRVVMRAVYNVLGVNFWLSILTDLKSRGVKDILFACTDNLTGFSEAILASFPESEPGRRAIQSCIIHEIRNSLKYIASKDQKIFMQDLKTVYQAPTKDKAELELDKLNDKWGNPVVIKSWQSNWYKLSTYFAYDE